MSRKHYQIVARRFALARAAYVTRDRCANALDLLALAMAEDFAADNPRFDRVRFLRACGMDL